MLGRSPEQNELATLEKTFEAAALHPQMDRRLKVRAMRVSFNRMCEVVNGVLRSDSEASARQALVFMLDFLDRDELAPYFFLQAFGAQSDRLSPEEKELKERMDSSRVNFESVIEPLKITYNPQGT